MAKILCGISGIEYRTDHMPLYLTSREVNHPIFSVPGKKLLTLSERWITQELTSTENYLLYLALFNSTGLMDFRVPACINKDTASIIAQNMNHLVDIVDIILDHGTERAQELFHLPGIVITPDTKTLEDSPNWIKLWKNCYAEYSDKYRTSTALEKLTRKETILERLIKDRTKDISTYARQLADWAADAGQFEQHADYIVLDQRDRPILMKDYWKQIIVACAKSESIWEIPDIDLTDLIEHCEEYIYHGSIYAHTLMSLLRAGAARKKDFLDLGTVDIGASGTTFRILDANASIEDANKLAAIDSAPLVEPVKSQYPNQLAFIKAKLNWKMAQDYKNAQALAEKVSQVNADYEQNKNKASANDAEVNVNLLKGL